MEWLVYAAAPILVRFGVAAFMTTQRGNSGGVTAGAAQWQDRFRARQLAATHRSTVRRALRSWWTDLEVHDDGTAVTCRRTYPTHTFETTVTLDQHPSQSVAIDVLRTAFSQCYPEFPPSACSARMLSQFLIAQGVHVRRVRRGNRERHSVAVFTIPALAQPRSSSDNDEDEDETPPPPRVSWLQRHRRSICGTTTQQQQ